MKPRPNDRNIMIVRRNTLRAFGRPVAKFWDVCRWLKFKNGQCKYSSESSPTSREIAERAGGGGGGR